MSRMTGTDVCFQDQLTERVIEAIITVHRALGPGFLESVYRNALHLELKKRGISVEMEKEVAVYYANEVVGLHRLDMLVEGAVVLELKTVESLHKAHYAQIRSYLKAAGCKTGLLINFAEYKADFRRIEMNLADGGHKHDE